MFVIDDIIMAEAAAALAPEMVAAIGAGEAAAGAGALEAAGAGAAGMGAEAAGLGGLDAALYPELAMYGAGSGLGIPPAAAMGPNAGAQLAQVGAQPQANAIATGIGPQAAADRVAGVSRSIGPQAAANRVAGSYSAFGEPVAVGSPAATMADPTGLASEQLALSKSTTEPSFFDKAYEWAKKNPGLAFSGGILGLQAIDRMTNRGIGGFPTYTPGPLDKYRLSPNFKPGRVDPSKYVYTPSYADGGTVDASQPVYMAGGGDPGAAMMSVYDRMMRRQPRADSVPGDMPSSPRSVGIVQDTDPDTRNLDALRATQVRMAKLRKRAGLPSESMPAYSSLGAMNVGIGKSGGADQELAKGGMLGTTGLGDYAAGGMPRLLKGPGDGMSDDIPATINNRQPARLADGEFVIPADVVSHLGNGSTDAGAKKLHEMMNKVRHARTGNSKQGKQIKPDKYMPK